MRFRTLGIMGIALAMCSSSSEATDMDKFLEKTAGKLDVSSEPVMANGMLMGCQIAFDGIIEDTTTAEHKYLKVGGSVGMFAGEGPQKHVGAFIRLIVLSINKSTGKMRPSRPSRVFLVDSTFNTNLASLVKASPAEAPGGLDAVFPMSPSGEILLDAIKRRKLVVAFNQNNGKGDIQLPIELGVTDDLDRRVKGLETAIEFSQCTSTMLNQVRAR